MVSCESKETIIRQEEIKNLNIILGKALENIMAWKEDEGEKNTQGKQMQ